MLKIYILLLGLLIHQNARATSADNGVWWGTFVKKQTSVRNSIWAETQIRYNLDLGEMAQFLYRTGLLRKYRNNHEAGILYGFIHHSEFGQSGSAHVKHHIDQDLLDFVGEASKIPFSV